MRNSDHAIIHAAVQAKRQRDQQRGSAPADGPQQKPVSGLDKAITAGLWLAAAGSLAALMVTG
jgi:hypothetical protein